jgi:hypothetical protein
MVGAQQRLVEIANEQNAIFAAFPELRGRKGNVGAAENNAESQPVQPKRRRGRMSAEARKRISDAQKARWAKQKAANATSATKPKSRQKK